jgi:uncharacterized iron-regulated membrane protein
MLKQQDLKNKFLYYHKQKKFQLSVVDWTPCLDWIFILIVFFILISFGAWFSYITYIKIVSEINEEENIFIPRKKDVDFEKVELIKQEYKNRAEVLNSLE